MSDFIRRKICNGVTFGSFSDDRFKKGRISATLLTPLKRETAAANALLSCVLTRSCRKYPDFTSLARKLEELYGAGLYNGIRQIGDHQALTLTVTGLDDKYTFENDSISGELAELLCNIMFDPDVRDGKFAEENLEQERRQILEDIESENNDKRLFAIKRCVEIMCENETYSIGRFGDKEDIEALENQDVYKAWERLMDSARVELTMLGDSSPEYAFESFRDNFSGKPRAFVPGKPETYELRELKRVTETEELSQSKLVLGLRCEAFDRDPDCIANSLMSIILGGTPTSKLFLNVREKKSLCYYCVSRVDSNKGVMLIDSGVETENLSAAEEAILEQLEEMKKGNITADELENAKLALKNAYLSSLDSLASIQSYYVGGLLIKDKLSPQEAAGAVDDINLDRITELAKKVKLDTIYTLKGR